MTETNPFGGFSIAMVEDATPATGGPSTFTSAADRVEAKVVIVGSGPAGLTAAIYAARADRSEERRVGKECSLPCRSRWSPYH